METITEKAADRIKALETQENLEKLERLNFYFVNNTFYARGSQCNGLGEEYRIPEDARTTLEEIKTSPLYRPLLSFINGMKKENLDSFVMAARSD